MRFHSQRLGDGQRRRPTAVDLGIRLVVHLRGLDVLRLEARGRRMRFVLGDLLLGSGRMLNAARSAGVSHVVGIHNRVLLDDGPVDVGSVNDGGIHIHYRRVVSKRATAPLTAGKADSHVAKAVVHAAIVAHVVAPVAGMEDIEAAGPTPIGGRPQAADEGRGNPCARHPEVPFIAIGPVAGRPHEIGLGADGLDIDRKHRWSEVDADEHARVRRCGDGAYEQSEQKQTCRAKKMH